ncbi:hypothetical protein EJB05_56813, partial [Eragrostis curvula]
MATTHYGSASAIVGETVHRLFHINCYSRTKEAPPSRLFLSHSFKVGDCSWRICLCRPVDDLSSSAGYISIFLGLDDDVAEPVKARAAFSLLDWAGNPVPDHTLWCTDLHEYSAAGVGYGFDNFIRREFLEESGHLVDDCFAIGCDVTVLRRRCMEDIVIVPPSNLHLHFGDLLESGVGADVTFQVAGETFSAHRCVLTARSPVFKAELLGKVCVRIDDMDPRAFEKLLHFVYTDSLPKMTKEEEFEMATHLLAAADWYEMHRLKLICAETLREYIDLNTVVNLVVLAERHGCYRLKKDCIDYLRYPPTLNVVMAFGGFEHVTQYSPALLRELWDVWFEDEPLQDDLALSL